MAVELKVTLSEREADALLKAFERGRSGWQPRTSHVLQNADFKITAAIQHHRANAEAETGDNR